MIGTSKLYRWILLLYPEPFRIEFGDEMLQAFDECRAAQGSLHLLTDVLLSAARQQIDYLLSPRLKDDPVHAGATRSPVLQANLGIAIFCVAILWSALVQEICTIQKPWTTPHSFDRSCSNLMVTQGTNVYLETQASRD